jgi:hypothetical protein
MVDEKLTPDIEQSLQIMAGEIVGVGVGVGNIK